ncbi:MAG: VCBS repeat-containing protein [Polyangiaceae bacterium]
MGRFRFAAIFASVSLLLSCDDSASSGSSTSGGMSTGSSMGGAPGTSASTGNLSSSSGFNGTGTGGGCPVGTACEGGVCDASGACCPIADACGTDCCDGGSVCSFLKCVVPGAVCVDSSECGADEFCDFSFPSQTTTTTSSSTGTSMCMGGTEVPTGKCMPKPPVCPGGTDPGDPPACVAKCEYHPPTAFAPELKFSWGDPTNTNQNVMMSPIVVQLDDDNCDGKIDQNDIPEIVYFTFDGGDYNNTSGTSSTLHAISIVEGAVVEKLAVSTDGASADSPGRQIAAGNLDADPAPEIVTCTKDGRLRAYKAGGSILWTSAAGGPCFMPSIADLEHDGVPEVVDTGRILAGPTGAVLHTFAAENVVVSDVVGDDKLEVVGSRRVFSWDGQLLIDSGVVGTHPAVGDLDLDGVPEIVTVDFTSHTVSVWHPDPVAAGGFAIVRSGLDINAGIATNQCCTANPASAGCTKGGGPPTIARFNADQYPDVAFAGGIGYVVFDGQKLMDGVTSPAGTRMWEKDTRDCSSAQTGSSVFDFEGDGKAEVVYADEVNLHIYRGDDGFELFTTCNTSGTLWEYPLVADVDSDGHADIIVASNSYASTIVCANNAKTTGIRVFGDTVGKWVRTRRVWNEHAYHVTNINDDGSVPMNEVKNYVTPGLDNFRQNVQPSGQFSAPDLVVSIAPICTGPYGLRARVQNIGEAAVPPGVIVGFYVGDPSSGGTKIGSGATVKTLYPLGFEDVDLPLAAEPAGNVAAVVDDGSPPHPWVECRTDNNQSSLTDPSCAVPQ